MPHTITFDPADKLVTVAILGLWTEEDATVLDGELRKLLPQAGNAQAAIDLGTAIRYSGTEARRLTAKILQDQSITHLAVYNARPAVRILVKILLKLVADATAARFFATREEAVAWLKQERQAP